MKKIIVLFYCRICVDVLGFPIYLKHTKTKFRVSKSVVLMNNFNLDSNVLYESELIKQH
jgi:hypothetical protein